MASALLLILTFAVGACGGDDGGGASSATTAASGPLSATALVPQLQAKGYNQTVPEKVQGTGKVDVVFTIYEQATGARTQGRIEVRVYPDEGVASGDYTAQATGWKTPPPGLFGADLGNADSAPVAGFRDAKAYTAGKADARGNRVFTDVYRQGRVIVVTHVLGPDAGAAQPLRQLLADGIKANVR